MSKLKRFASKEDNIVVVHTPVSNEEFEKRMKDYPLLTPRQFGTKYKNLLFTPSKITWNDKTYEIQVNHCSNPYCKWHGMPQEKFEVRGKRSRYKIHGTGLDKTIFCNPEPFIDSSGIALNCFSATLSNWSIAQEIERLIRINSVQDIQPEYIFHKEECTSGELTPFSEPKAFYKRGKSTGKSQKWQCKSCRKITNVLPERERSITYNQKRSDILLLFTKLLLHKTPISRTCDILSIGRGTYYDKLEFVYRRCLEFLERRETRPLESKAFSEIWINTDKVIYHLNNVRKKGMGGREYSELEDSTFPTQIVVSSDVFSRYVFRSDIAYD
ncbi:hypothetical protein [Priestia flexa]|uniref:hypothetical protein n=1 Tax=Priestia flexa TaxID=86664 RepID=UPI001FF8B27C|nr:hypothetical protein [Priestia flexa]